MPPLGEAPKGECPPPEASRERPLLLPECSPFCIASQYQDAVLPSEPAGDVDAFANKSIEEDDEDGPKPTGSDTALGLVNLSRAPLLPLPAPCVLPPNAPPPDMVEAGKKKQNKKNKQEKDNGSAPHSGTAQQQLLLLLLLLLLPQPRKKKGNKKV